MGIQHHHHTVIATSFQSSDADRISKWIATLTEREQSLFVRTGSWVNNYVSFALMPVGSKEGWADSDAGDKLRAAFIATLQLDGFWDFVEVGFGECGTQIVKTNCEDRYS